MLEIKIVLNFPLNIHKKLFPILQETGQIDVGDIAVLFTSVCIVGFAKVVSIRETGGDVLETGNVLSVVQCKNEAGSKVEADVAMCPPLSLFRREGNRDGDTYESYTLESYRSTTAYTIPLQLQLD